MILLSAIESNSTRVNTQTSNASDTNSSGQKQGGSLLNQSSSPVTQRKSIKSKGEYTYYQKPSKSKLIINQLEGMTLNPIKNTRLAEMVNDFKSSR